MSYLQFCCDLKCILCWSKSWLASRRSSNWLTPNNMPYDSNKWLRACFGEASRGSATKGKLFIYRGTAHSGALFIWLSKWCGHVGVFDLTTSGEPMVETRSTNKLPPPTRSHNLSITRFALPYVSRNQFNPGLYWFQHTVDSRNSKTSNTKNSFIGKINY